MSCVPSALNSIRIDRCAIPEVFPASSFMQERQSAKLVGRFYPNRLARFFTEQGL